MFLGVIIICGMSEGVTGGCNEFTELFDNQQRCQEELVQVVNRISLQGGHYFEYANCIPIGDSL